MNQIIPSARLSRSLLAIGLCFALSISFETAYGASFDCAKAGSNAEKAICASPQLGQLDQQIHDAYYRVEQSLGEPYQRRYREVQQQWLKRRDALADLASAWQEAQAGAGKHHGKHFPPSGQLEKLEKLMQERLARLREPTEVTLNSLTFLRLDGDDRPPYLLTRLPGTDAYNRWADRSFAETLAYTPGEVKLLRCHVPHAPASCNVISTTSLFSIEYASPEILSISRFDSSFGWRAAHPADRLTGHNWWLSRSGTVNSADVFTGTSYREVIRARVEQHDGSSCDADCAKKAVGPDDWTLTPEHLRITSPDGYSFLGIGRGTDFVDIPWSDFKQAVNPGFLKKLQAYPPLPGTDQPQ